MSELSTEKKIYSGIDICKLIASILVVLLHSVETTAWIPCEIKYVCTRFAVPFFFIASGFFYFIGLKRSQDSKQYFINYEKNLLLFLVVWSMIYLPFEIKAYIQNNPGAGWLKITFLLFRRFLVIGAGPYWYLLALIISAAVIFLIYQSKKEWILIIWICLGLLLEFVYSSLNGILSGFFLYDYFYKAIYFVFSWEFNFIMYGVPFMGIGLLISKHNLRLSFRKAITIFILATLVRVLEYQMPRLIPSVFWEHNQISLAFIVQAIAFFMLAKEWQINISKQRSLTIRQLSSFIYFLHAIVLYEVLNPLLTRFTDWPIYEGWFIPIKLSMVLIPCILLFMVIKKINNKYLNVLING